MQSQGAPHGDTAAALTPALLGKYWPRARQKLVATLVARGVDEDVAEDAVAEAATRALCRGLLVVDEQDFCRWVFVVARNIVHDSSRRSQRVLLMDEVPDRAADYDLTRHVEARESWRATAEAFERLSETDKAALLDAIDPAEHATRREATRQAVRRHRARAHLKQALGQLGGWLGWMRRPPWMWPVPLVPPSLSDGVAIALLPFLAAGLLGTGGGALSGRGLPVAAPAAAVVAPALASVTPGPSAGEVRGAGGRVDRAPDAPVADAAAPSQPEGWRFQFTPSPAYEQDHTVYANGGESASSCGSMVSGCALLYRSRDGGATWELLPAVGRGPGRILLPPGYPDDSRIFSASENEVQVSTDGGQSFSLLTRSTGPAAMTPTFSAGDPRFLFGSDRVLRSATTMQYTIGDEAPTPLVLPLPAGAAAMELWFAPGYVKNGRMLVTALEAPALVGLNGGGARLAFTVPSIYMCERGACTRVIDSGMDILPPMVAMSGSGTVLVGSSWTLDRSTDGGASFQRLALPGAGDRRSLSALAIAPDGRVYAKVSMPDSGLQLYASDDSGETWTLLREDKLGFYNLTVLPDGKLIEGRPGGGPSGGGAGVRCSADGGRTWQEHCGQVQPR